MKTKSILVVVVVFFGLYTELSTANITEIKPFLFGIGAKEGININVGGNLGTVPSGDTLVIRTDSITPPPVGGVMLRSGLTVPGDVIIGPGGDPDIAIELHKNVIITGEAIAAENYMDFPTITPPSLPVGSWAIDPYDPTIAYINTDGEFSNLTIGGLIQTVKTVYIQGDVDIYVPGAVLINPEANLVVTAGSSLTLYVGGSLLVRPGAYMTYDDGIFMTDAEIVEAALSTSIIGTDTCQFIKLYNSGSFYGAVYAPEASVEIGNTAGFYGAVVGDKVDIKNSGVFCYVTEIPEPATLLLLGFGAFVLRRKR